MLRRTAVRLMARRGGLRRRHAEAVPKLLPVDPRAFEDTLLLPMLPIDAQTTPRPSSTRLVDVPLREPSRARRPGGGIVA